MSDTGGRFKHESLQDPDSIIKYLNALSEGFKEGALVFTANGKRLVLKPKGLVNLDVEAKRKNESNKLTLKFRWSDSSPTENDNGQTLIIEPLSE